jgi:hypothetical protein
MMKLQQLHAIKPANQPPVYNILDRRFKYVPASKTNILKRFRAMGWVPPSERKVTA